MKKVLTASLVAMMAVSAANADIASTNYVTKSIEALDGSTATTGTKSGKYVVTVSQTDGTVGSATVGFDEKISASSDNTNAPTSKAVYDVIDALDTPLVGADGSYIKFVSQANGQLSAEKEEFLKTKEEIVATENVNNAPSAGAVVGYVTERLSIVDGNAGEAMSAAESAQSAAEAAQATADGAQSAAEAAQATADGAQSAAEAAQATADGAQSAAEAAQATADKKFTTAQGDANKNKAVITDGSGNVKTGQIAEGMIANDAVTSAKIAPKTIVNDDISDGAAIAQSKISGLSDSLGLKMDKATLTDATKAGTGETNTTADGTYTLTMKVSNGNQTYIWEKIGR